MPSVRGRLWASDSGVAGLNRMHAVGRPHAWVLNIVPFPS
jgi:hypothetical protein